MINNLTMKFLDPFDLYVDQLVIKGASITALVVIYEARVAHEIY